MGTDGTIPRQCYLEGGFGSSSGWAHPTIDRQEVLSAEPEIALVRDHAGRIALHYVCTYNGSKHQGRQLYAGAPVEATRIVRAHVARCTTSRAASPSRDVPEHSIAKSVRVRVCVGAVCVSARVRAHARHMCISVWRCSKLVPVGRQWPSRAVTVH